MERSNFLPEKYADLPGSKPVERAVQKKIRAGEKGARTKEARVEAYLDRLESIFKKPMGKDKARGERGGFDLLKNKILGTYITKFEDIPQSYWQAQEAEIRRRGEGGDWDNTPEEQKYEVKKKTAETVLNDQRASLEQWVDYLESSDSDYIPRNLKYWIFRNVLNLQELIKVKDKQGQEHIEFPRRSKGTVKPFPDINHEALAYVVDALVKKFEGQPMEFEHDIQPEEREAFNKFLAKEDFTRLYSWANELMNPVPEHLLPETKGEWRKYPQNSKPEKLVQTIRGRGTGWCTAGLNTAKTQLQGGDFYVYYTLDDEGKPTVPRLAIRMEGQDKIAEDPRGIAYKQNLDPYMAPVLENKLQEFGQVGEAYKKKSGDMKMLTAIDAKVKQDDELSKDDLIFLYEINTPIEGFGYQKDPRIKELRNGRQARVEEDMLVIFDCAPDQIARTPDQISPNTRAYIGKLEQGIFTKLSEDVEHVYTAFPEGRVRRLDIEIGGKNAKQLETDLREKNINISDYAQDMLRSPEFQVSKNPEQATLVRLKVADLFSDNNFHTTAEIMGTKDDVDEQGNPAPFTSGAMTRLGLELCPAETGPHYRLQYQNQPMNEWFVIGMKPIAGRFGYPFVFGLERFVFGVRLVCGSTTVGRSPAASGIPGMSLPSASASQKLRTLVPLFLF